jgi:predicted Zn-dependent peptidase
MNKNAFRTNPIKYSAPDVFYNKTILDNGIRVISETIPYVRSVTIGFWVNVGSRDETLDLNGITHFLEHMVFKGTKKYSASQIAKRIEAYGGYLNAFTGKENTCFYGKVLDKHLDKAIDVISELILAPLLKQKDVEKEKLVILEELKNIEDDPEDLINDVFDKSLYGDHSLGYPVVGRAKNIKQFLRSDLLKYLQQHYIPKNIVVAAAGNVQHDELVRQVEKRFKNIGLGNGTVLERAAPKLSCKGKYIEENKPIQQAHVSLGTHSFGIKSKYRYPLVVMNTLLGEGMSSRLFQNIREKFGFAYSVFSFINLMGDCGNFGVYIGTNKENIKFSIELIQKELLKLKNKHISKAEIDRTKEQVKGSMMLSQESTTNRMMRLATSEIYFNNFSTLDEITGKIDTVTSDDVYEVANKILDVDNFVTVVFSPTKN